ncbi:MAG: Asp-tRNA(Asn)/Glu-tRNA(Gln) amidotransferase subunit GatC [Anaerolineales bacterium]
MALTREEVEHIAALAHLELSEEELTHYQEQLSAILDHAARLQALDTEEISPTATVLPLRSVLREDAPRPSLPRAEALANAPEVEEGSFFVPPIVTQE